jgi:hypothetical protein
MEFSVTTYKTVVIEAVNLLRVFESSVHDNQKALIRGIIFNPILF